MPKRSLKRTHEHHGNAGFLPQLRGKQFQDPFCRQRGHQEDKPDMLKLPSEVGIEKYEIELIGDSEYERKM